MNSENERTIEDCNNEISSIKTWIDKNPLDSNVRFLVAYAVVKASGTIEIVFKSIIHTFLSEGCKNETKTYLEKMVIDSSSNPNTGNMLKILEQIDIDRKSRFEDGIKGNQAKGDLNSLVTLRNDIAHGRSINVSINTIKQYYESGKKVVNFLDSVLDDLENAKFE